MFLQTIHILSFEHRFCQIISEESAHLAIATFSFSLGTTQISDNGLSNGFIQYIDLCQPKWGLGFHCESLDSINF